MEVRVFYDDMGSIGFINTDFVKKMETIGIHCRVFNPFMPGLNLFLNNRDPVSYTHLDVYKRQPSPMKNIWTMISYRACATG